MRVHRNTRGNSQLHSRYWQAFGMQCVQAIKFVETVDNNVMHIGIDRHAQFVHALVIAVHHATATGNTSL